MQEQYAKKHTYKNKELRVYKKKKIEVIIVLYPKAEKTEQSFTLSHLLLLVQLVQLLSLRIIGCGDLLLLYLESLRILCGIPEIHPYRNKNTN
jgi:hypothetical protein